MSATNRGTERKAYDFYATPISSIQLLFNSKQFKPVKVLEPSAGNGNIVKTVKDNFPDSHVTAYEIRQEEQETLQEVGADSTIIADFLTVDIAEKYDLIIGNPPYSEALEFIQKSLQCLSDEGQLVFLLRTNFLESKKRFQFWQDFPLSELYVLSKRPSFTGKGSDATSYSWFVWSKKEKDKQVIKVI